MAGDLKTTIPGLRQLKSQGRKIRMVTAYDYNQACLVDESPIELILVGDSLGNVALGYRDTLPVTMEQMLHHTGAVARGALRTPVIGDLPFLSYQVSPEEAIRNGGTLLKAGASGVKLEGGGPSITTVKRMSEAGIPVMGHLGLTPQRALELGGYKVQGRRPEEAQRLLAEALALEEAGAFALVLECVPGNIAGEVSKGVKIPVIGIGAGPECDGQVLVLHDLLGLLSGSRPRFVKSYVDGAGIFREALGAFAKEVEKGVYPGEEHTYGEVGKKSG